jgi:hypothetical protein
MTRSTLVCGTVIAVLVHLSVASGQPPASEQRAVVEALARYRHEPSVREVIAALHSHASSATSDELASRARLSGWVPTVGLKARRGQAVDLASTSDQDALRFSTDDNLTLEAALTFDLGRVVFAREEVAIARQAHAEREHESERVRDVIALYFERRRLQVERDLLAEQARARAAPGPIEDGGVAPQGGRTAAATSAPRGADAESAVIARNVRIAEIEALLDAFTGGAFRRMMARPRSQKSP